MYHDLLSGCLKSIVLCCRYQILGVFLLIQLCIIAAEGLRRTNLSSIASSVHQTSLGTHQASAGSDSRTVALIEIFFEFAFSHIIISQLNYDYFFLWSWVFVGRGIPVLNEGGNLVTGDSDMGSWVSDSKPTSEVIFQFVQGIAIPFLWLLF